MTSVALDPLRRKALELNDTEQAELAHDLVASLEGEPDADATDAWDEEILRRLMQIDDGTAEFVDRSELKRMLRAQLTEN